MGVGIGGLFIDLGLNLATFVTDVNRVNQNLDSMQKKANVALGKMVNSFNSGRDSVNKFGQKLFSAQGIMAQLAGTAGIGLLINKSFELAGNLVDTADAVGLTTTQLQAYQFAATQGGLKSEEFNKALSKFVLNVGDAKNGTGSLTSAFKDLDPVLLNNIRNAQSQDQAFRLVADAIKNAKNETEAAAISSAAFGDKVGVKMVNALREGSAGLDEFTRQAQAAGLIMDEQLIRQAEAAGDKLSLLADSAIKKVSIEVVKLSPQIMSLTQTLIDLIPTLIRFADVIVKAIILPFEGWGKVVDYVHVGLVKTQEAMGMITKEVAKEHIKLIGEQANHAATEINKLNGELAKTNAAPAVAPKIAPVIQLPKASSGMAGNEIPKLKIKNLSPDVKLDDSELPWKKETQAINEATNAITLQNQAINSGKDIMQGFLNGSIKSWKDLGKVAVDQLGNILSSMASGGAGGGGLGGLFGSIFSGGAGGGMGASMGGALVKAGGAIASAFGGGFGGFFAEGGTLKPGQWGWAGENGPERIYAGNRPLNVESNQKNGRPIQVNFHVSTPNAESFQRSQGQLTAQAAMAIRSAGRNL